MELSFTFPNFIIHQYHREVGRKINCAAQHFPVHTSENLTVLRAHLVEVKRMLSQMPIKVERVSEKLLDCEILRVAIIAELDAINLYEQLAAAAGDENVKKVLLEVAREEKTHLESFKRSS
jgi:demethoxyubiquinone hydroxylase (CLK1/Coq7/Cat5 family)